MDHRAAVCEFDLSGGSSLDEMAGSRFREVLEKAVVGSQTAGSRYVDRRVRWSTNAKIWELILPRHALLFEPRCDRGHECCGNSHVHDHTWAQTEEFVPTWEIN